jgi:hypothetical protein
MSRDWNRSSTRLKRLDLIAIDTTTTSCPRSVIWCCSRCRDLVSPGSRILMPSTWNISQSELILLQYMYLYFIIIQFYISLTIMIWILRLGLLHVGTSGLKRVLLQRMRLGFFQNVNLCICYGLFVCMCGQHVCVTVRMYSYVLQKQNLFSNTK